MAATIVHPMFTFANLSLLRRANGWPKTPKISVRVPPDTRAWLKRRTHKMGPAGSAAARILEESRRKETYRGIDFRDTPDGRLALVSETRVPVHLLARMVRDYDGSLRDVAAHYPRIELAGGVRLLVADREAVGLAGELIEYLQRPRRKGGRR